MKLLLTVTENSEQLSYFFVLNQTDRKLNWVEVGLSTFDYFIGHHQGGALEKYNLLSFKSIETYF